MSRVIRAGAMVSLAVAGSAILLRIGVALADPLNIFIVNQMDRRVVIGLDWKDVCALEPGRSCMVSVPDGQHMLDVSDADGMMGRYDVTNPGAALHMRVFDERLEPM